MRLETRNASLQLWGLEPGVLHLVEIVAKACGRESATAHLKVRTGNGFRKCLPPSALEGRGNAWERFSVGERLKGLDLLAVCWVSIDFPTWTRLAHCTLSWRGMVREQAAHFRKRCWGVVGKEAGLQGAPHSAREVVDTCCVLRVGRRGRCRSVGCCPFLLPVPSDCCHSQWTGICFAGRVTGDSWTRSGSVNGAPRAWGCRVKGEGVELGRSCVGSDEARPMADPGCISRQSSSFLLTNIGHRRVF